MASTATEIWHSICDALCDLVSFVQFKKRGKHPWRSVNTFFKLYKWYQIAQRITYSYKSFCLSYFCFIIIFLLRKECQKLLNLLHKVLLFVWNIFCWFFNMFWFFIIFGLLSYIAQANNHMSSWWFHSWTHFLLCQLIQMLDVQ